MRENFRLCAFYRIYAFLTTFMRELSRICVFRVKEAPSSVEEGVILLYCRVHSGT